MGLTRRQFLSRAGWLAAGGFLGPGLLANPLVQRALAATIGDRYFVVLFLDGGNDGLNTVTPVADGGGALRTAYDVARRTGAGGLNLPPEVLGATLIDPDPATGAPLALHPGLAGLKSLYDLGAVAVIQGCGYPSYSLSHEQSRMVWQSGRPFASAGTGWMGRYLAANYGGSEIPSVNIAGGVAGDFAQSTTSVLAIHRLRDFRFPYHAQSGAAERARVADAFRALYAAAGAEAQPALAHVGAAGSATLLSAESYPQLDAAYRTARGAFDQAYEGAGSSTARDLREVAKIIHGVEQGVPNVHARFFQLRNGGYDTHSDQGGADPAGQHFALHRELGDALAVFHADLADMGVADKVCVLVWSEFSRRVPQNDNGTDHGSQGPIFVIGGAVQGGVYGNHPNIEPSALDRNGNTVYSQSPLDPFRSTDFRDVYGTILKHWLGMPAATITGGVLPVDGGNPATRWTAPNLDLGFLP